MSKDFSKGRLVRRKHKLNFGNYQFIRLRMKEMVKVFCWAKDELT
jgi:hypothetical protein